MRFIIALAIAITGCTTAHTVDDIDTKLETKGYSTYGEIGLNDKGQAVVQVKKSAEVELRAQEMANYDLAERVRNDAWHLHDCRVQMADPKNGGSGEVAPIPRVDSMKPLTKVQEELGLAEDGSLVVTTKEFFDEKLAAEKKFTADLYQMLETLTPLREDCERTLGYKTAGVK